MITMEIIGVEELKTLIAGKSAAMVKSIQVALLKGGERLKREAIGNLRNNKSVITGVLAKSFNVIPDGDHNGVTVTTEVMYAPFVEQGTAAHDIAIKNKKVLATTEGIGGGGGYIFFGKLVHHPGSKAKPFFVPAYEVARAQVLEELSQIVEGT